MKNPTTAKAIMSTSMGILDPELSCYEAAHFLLKNHLSGAPVVDKEGHYLGEFNEQSCLNALLEALHDEQPGVTVRENLRPHEVTLTEDSTLAAIAEKFRQTRQRILPVLKDDRTIGVISRRDVIKAVIEYCKNVPDKKAGLLYLSALSEPDDVPGIIDECK